MIIPLLLLSLSFSSCINATWPYLPFDDAMQQKKFPDVYTITTHIVGIDGNTLYEFFKNMYEAQVTCKAQSKLIIPKIIHQIWLGSPFPEEFKGLQQSWIEHHQGRGWMYKLWTDNDVAQLHLHNQELYDATDNYGVKSDILRYELLFNYGGIYADVDCECLRSFDELHYTYDFYTGLQPLDALFVQIGTALIASRPGHPILKYCIETIKNNWHLKGAPKKTGPVHFTKSFYAMAGRDGNKDMIFPAFYFNPLGCRDTIDNRVAWAQQGAFAIHWWAKSWMPKHYRPSLSKNIDNEQAAISWND